MNQFIVQQSFFESHAMDADNRKSTDTAESPKHWLDIDYYPNFYHLTRNLDSLISQYGWTVVKQKGINPWATVWCLDSLTAQLTRGDWSKAYLTASDLGHYVGDAHQPLHCTENYNGYLTGNNGIHSRYESTMITDFQDSLFVIPDSVFYIDDPINYIFAYILHSQTLVDSVMQADNYAKAMSGWSGSGTPPSQYYMYLWQGCQTFTIDQFQRATVDLASFWYTAWVNAGLLPPPSSVRVSDWGTPTEFLLRQNYPNPFNPSTTVSYVLSRSAHVTLKVNDMNGREIAILLDEFLQPGEYKLRFDASRLSSGVYLYRLQVGSLVQTKKMLLLK